MARTDFQMIRDGETSRAPNVGAALRSRLAEMVRPLEDAALVGSGLGVEETEHLSRALQDVVRLAREEAEERRLSTVPGAVAIAFRDLDHAEKAIREARAALSAGIDGHEIDPDGSVARGVANGISLCLRAQSTIGAARLVRS